MANAEHALSSLGDPTRRALLQALRQGPMTVGQLSAITPVTRSAVSQHLQHLKAAALVVERREGTRRFYSLDPAALGELRAYVDGLWSDALTNFSETNGEEGGNGHG
jgi:DNA-binding transcriptional ArsR family regulator